MKAYAEPRNRVYGVEYTTAILESTGEVAEWLKAHAWKACVRGNSYREFESHPLRHVDTIYSVVN